MMTAKDFRVCSRKYETGKFASHRFSSINEDHNNNSSENIVGYRDDEESVNPRLNPQNTTAKDDFVLEVGVSADDFIADADIEDELSEDDPPSPPIRLPSSSSTRTKSKPLSRENSPSTSGVSIVPNPKRKANRRPYKRKNQSLRKDTEIKNRFSRELREKRDNEQRNKKVFENVVSLDTDNIKKVKLSRIPKVNANAAAGPVPIPEPPVPIPEPPVPIPEPASSDSSND